MPIIRKIINVGQTSKGVILPKSWLDYAEREQGSPVNEVALEVNGILTIRPYMSPKREES